MNFALSSDLSCDLERLILSKLLVQSNSGGGKSRTIRRLLEQTAGRVQHLVMDPEGEFASLREKHDYLLVAPTGGDVAADPKTARRLAERLLELHASAILDIFELSPHDRILFVKEFMEGLVDAPKKLWHPALVVLDEAHHFCPEVGHAESSDAVKAMASRGRKRGFSLILATQRLSKLHKDTAAECLNKLIGRTGLDVDLRRACDELGFQKGDWAKLRTLEPGQFYAYGPALCQTPRVTTIGPCFTTHPEAGSKMMAAPAPPPTEKVKALLQKLSDLPAEAERKRKTEEDLRREVAELRRQLAQKPSTPAPKVERVEVPTIDAATLERLRMFGHAWADRSKDFKGQADEFRAQAEGLERLGRDLIAALDRAARGRTSSPPAPRPSSSTRLPRSFTPPKGPARLEVAKFDGEPLDGPEQRILDAIAWMNAIGVEEPETTAVAFVAEYRPKGGAFCNPKGRLRGKGLIEYRGKSLVLTEEGRALARFPDTSFVSDEALHAAVLGRLDGPGQKILKVLLEAWPEGVTNDALAEASGYSPGGGAFANPRGRLKTLGLVEYPEPGVVRARDILFPEGCR